MPPSRTICNLVNVSSIIPPGCAMVSRKEGPKSLKAGEIAYVVLARNATREPTELPQPP